MTAGRPMAGRRPMSRVPRSHRFGAVAAVAALAVACSEDPGAGRPGQPEAIGSSSDLRPWAIGPSVAVEHEATSVDDVFLSRVLDVVVDSRGGAYLIDTGDAAVVTLNPDLTHDRTIGREGEGPGEFLYPIRLQVLPGDSLVVWDSRLQRSTVFAAGSDEPTYVHSPGTQERIDIAWRLPGHARYVGKSSPAFTPDASDEGRTQVLRSVREEAGQVLDDVFAEYPDDEGLVFRRPGMVAVGPHPFGRRSFFEMLGERMVHASSDAVAVRIIDLDGCAEVAFAYEVPPIRVTAAELDTAAEEAGDRLGSVLREGAPHVWPALTGLVVDDEDRIWLGIRKVDRASVEWAAFTPEGTHLLSVDLPAGFEVQAVSGGRIVGVVEDGLETPRVFAYRLP